MGRLLATRIRAASGEGGRTCRFVRRRAGRRAPAGIAGGEPDDYAARFSWRGEHGRGGQIGLRQGMAGEAEAFMRFWGRQFLPVCAQMHGAIPIRGADDRRHPRICHMGQAERRREDGLHQEQCRDQAHEEGGGAFHGKQLNPARATCLANLSSRDPCHQIVIHFRRIDRSLLPQAGRKQREMFNLHRCRAEQIIGLHKGHQLFGCGAVGPRKGYMG